MKTSPLLAITLIVLPALGASCGDDDTSGDASGGGERTFCAVLADIDALFADLSEESQRDDVVAAVDRVVTLLDEATATAPAELDADVSAITEAQRGRLQAVIDADYDLAAFWAGVDEEGFTLEDSAARLAAYASDECGIDVED